LMAFSRYSASIFIMLGTECWRPHARLMGMGEAHGLFLGPLCKKV
jgi:hypothetical protein